MPASQADLRSCDPSVVQAERWPRSWPHVIDGGFSRPGFISPYLGILRVAIAGRHLRLLRGIHLPSPSWLTSHLPMGNEENRIVIDLAPDRSGHCDPMDTMRTRDAIVTAGEVRWPIRRLGGRTFRARSPNLSSDDFTELISSQLR